MANQGEEKGLIPVKVSNLLPEKENSLLLKILSISSDSTKAKILFKEWNQSDLQGCLYLSKSDQWACHLQIGRHLFVFIELQDAVSQKFTLVIPWLEIWWVSSVILPQHRSTCSAGQANTCPIRFSLRQSCHFPRSEFNTPGSGLPPDPRNQLPGLP